MDQLAKSIIQRDALIENYNINLNLINNNTSFQCWHLIDQSGIINLSGLKRYNLQAVWQADLLTSIIFLILV